MAVAPLVSSPASQAPAAAQEAVQHGQNCTSDLDQQLLDQQRLMEGEDGGEPESEEDVEIEAAVEDSPFDVDAWISSKVNWAFYAVPEDKPDLHEIGWFTAWSKAPADTKVVEDIATLLCAARDKFLESRGGLESDNAAISKIIAAGDLRAAEEMRAASQVFCEENYRTTGKKLELFLREGMAAMLKRRQENIEAGHQKPPPADWKPKSKRNEKSGVKGKKTKAALPAAVQASKAKEAAAIKRNAAQATSSA